jgi:hypothetical protein
LFNEEEAEGRREERFSSAARRNLLPGGAWTLSAAPPQVGCSGFGFESLCVGFEVESCLPPVSTTATF